MLITIAEEAYPASEVEEVTMDTEDPEMEFGWAGPGPPTTLDDADVDMDCIEYDEGKPFEPVVMVILDCMLLADELATTGLHEPKAD